MEAIDRSATLEAANAAVLTKLSELYREAFAHDGFAELRVEIRILRRGQKEVILHCGKQYRFIVDYRPSNPLAWELRREPAGDSDPARIERRKRQEVVGFDDRRRHNKV